MSLSPQTCPKSLFSRIGLRKHSMLSLDSSGSPNYHENRSFSFDDIIKKSDSQKKLDKRSTSPAQFDKKELLHSLVAPPVSPKERRMSLDEFIQMSEKKILQRQNSRESALESTQETSFTKNDPTFRKRVNFVRRLEKIDSVSFENDREEDPSCVVQKDRDIELSGNDIGEYSDVGSPCSSRRSESYRGIDLCGVDYDTEKQSERRDDTSNVLRVHHSVGVDQSDCSSAEVDSSWTSSEVLNHIRSEVQVEIHEAPRDTEESTENTAEERNNEVQCESQLPNQRRALPSNLETSKGIVESGCCYTASDTGQKDGTIQVHHYCPSTGGDDGTQTESGFLRPPIGNDLLTKSDLGTPVMTSWEGSAGCDGHHKHSSLRTTMMPKTDFASLVVPTSPPLSISEKGHRKAPARDPSLKVPSHRPGSPTVGLLLKQHQLPLPPPRVEVSAYHLLEHSKPSKSRPPPLDILPQVLTPLSPYRKRIHVMEKTGSLDLPAPLITITTNVSSCESDTDSPTKTAANMHYLSPFDLIRQSTEHSTSLSNLSSSGYSSMASPGPSRCNSNSPLFGSDPDGDPNCISPGLRHSPSSIARKYGQHLCPSNIPYPVSPRHCPTGAAIHKTMLNNALGGVGRRFRPPLLRAATSIRKRSDSETTDEQPEPGSLQEDSNDDEGIGMDHIDFKIHRGEVTSAEDLELYMDREKASPIEDPTGKPLVGSREEESMGHSGGRELVCPAIVVQTLLQNEPDRDRCWKFVRRKSFQHRLSPVSSRSESPMSDRGCQNSNDKFASSFFGNDETHATDSDDLYNDGTCSPEDDIKLPVEPKPPTVTPQNRKQSRKTNKSHGCKAKSCTKLRPKSMSEMTCKDISCKRSPKRRLRVQNSVDDDSSSTESSSASGSPKEPLLFKDRRNNRIDSIHQHRKRYMARCESSPLPIARNGTWDSDDCSSRSGPKSAPGPLIDLDDHGSPSFVLDINNVHESKVMNEKNGDLHTPSSLPPYCNDVLDGDE